MLNKYDLVVFNKELDALSTCAKKAQVQMEGQRSIVRKIKYKAHLVKIYTIL